MYRNLVLLNVSLCKWFLKDSKFPIEFFTGLLPAQWDILSNRWNSTSEIQLSTMVGNIFFCWKHQFLNSKLSGSGQRSQQCQHACFSFHSSYFLTYQFYSWHLGHSKFLGFERSGLWAALKNYSQQVILKLFLSKDSRNQQ